MKATIIGNRGLLIFFYHFFLEYSVLISNNNFFIVMIPKEGSFLIWYYNNPFSTHFQFAKFVGFLHYVSMLDWAVILSRCQVDLRLTRGVWCECKVAPSGPRPHDNIIRISWLTARAETDNTHLNSELEWTTRKSQDPPNLLDSPKFTHERVVWWKVMGRSGPLLERFSKYSVNLLYSSFANKF